MSSMYIVGYGFLFWDSDDQWLKEYTQKIGACDTLKVKMWGIYTWVQITRRQGYINLIVETDSKFFIDMVIESCKLNRNNSILVKHIQPLKITMTCYS